MFSYSKMTTIISTHSMKEEKLKQKLFKHKTKREKKVSFEYSVWVSHFTFMPLITVHLEIFSSLLLFWAASSKRMLSLQNDGRFFIGSFNLFIYSVYPLQYMNINRNNSASRAVRDFYKTLAWSVLSADSYLAKIYTWTAIFFLRFLIFYQYCHIFLFPSP